MTWHLIRVVRMQHDTSRRGRTAGEGETGGRSRNMTDWLANLRAEGFDPYYPMIRELRPVPRRELGRHQRDQHIMRLRVVPFLPGFVFVPADEKAWWLLDHPGVVGMFMDGSGQHPARVRDGVIDNLKAREREGNGAIPGGTPVEYIFRVGDEVSFIHGSLGTIPGKVEAPPSCPIEEIDAETRLRLTVSMFGRETVVSARVADVVKV